MLIAIALAIGISAAFGFTTLLSSLLLAQARDPMTMLNWQLSGRDYCGVGVAGVRRQLTPAHTAGGGLIHKVR